MPVLRPPELAVGAAANSAITALLERHTGQQVTPSRSWRIEAALKAVMRDRQVATIEVLERAIRSGGDLALEHAVVEALLNHETSFFRDSTVLDQLVEAAIAMQGKVPERPLRLWSSGCSTGQEPLSLAMLFRDMERLGKMRFPEILATDVSVSAVERARAARYSQFEVQRGLPIRRLVEWFDNQDGEWVAKRELVNRVRYRRHNLARDLPPPGRFDLILCRNVLMYFAPERRTKVLDQFAGMLRPDGLVVLGAGETVIGQSDRLTPSQTHRGFYRLA